MKKNWIFFIVNLIGSIIFLLLPILSSPDFDLSFSFLNIAPFQQDFLGYLFVLFFFYAHYYWIIPRFYFSKNWMAYTLLLFLCFLVIHFVPGLIISMERPLVMPMMLPKGPPNKLPFFFQGHFIPFVSIGLFSLLLRIYSRWKEIEQENALNELKYLKAQINPHFLFNTLNLVYASSIEEKAKKTTHQLQLLSDMLRYVLNESHVEFVQIKEEIKYLKAYIELQESRNNIQVDVLVSISNASENNKIPTLVLLPFIENAFKYGVNPEETTNISIHIHTNAESLRLTVKNTVVATSNREPQHGIGIKNTHKRLTHLFPENFQLSFGQVGSVYSVDLEIPLLP
jgi:hypothetical protein